MVLSSYGLRPCHEWSCLSRNVCRFVRQKAHQDPLSTAWDSGLTKGMRKMSQKAKRPPKATGRAGRKGACVFLQRLRKTKTPGQTAFIKSKQRRKTALLFKEKTALSAEVLQGDEDRVAGFATRNIMAWQICRCSIRWGGEVRRFTRKAKYAGAS